MVRAVIVDVILEEKRLVLVVLTDTVNVCVTEGTVYPK